MINKKQEKAVNTFLDLPTCQREEVREVIKYWEEEMEK